VEDAEDKHGCPRVSPYRLATHLTGVARHITPIGRFGISLPAPSADALSATLYGHSTWRLLACAER